MGGGDVGAARGDHDPSCRRAGCWACKPPLSPTSAAAATGGAAAAAAVAAAAAAVCAGAHRVHLGGG